MDLTQRQRDPAGGAPAACAAILRGSLKPSMVVCALTVLVFLVVKGPGPALASLLAAAITGGSIAGGMFIMSRLVNADPLAFLGGVMVVYFGQMIVIGLATFGLSEASWLDSLTFGISALVAVIAWQVFLVMAFVRARCLVFDNPAPM